MALLLQETHQRTPAPAPRPPGRGSAPARQVGLHFAGSFLARSWYLPHFDRENPLLESRASRHQGCHRSRQPNMTSYGTDLDYQFVALLEQSNLALRRERQYEPHLVHPVALSEHIRFLSLCHGGRVLSWIIQHVRNVLQPLLA